MVRSVYRRIASAVVALVVIAMAGGMSFAVAGDYANRDIIPLGTTINGIAVGGQSVAAAKALVEQRIATPLLQPVSASFGAMTYTFDPKDSLAVDVNGMVVEALRPRRERSLFSRLLMEARHEAATVNVPVMLSVNAAATEGWIHEIASSIDTSPTDAAISVENGTLRLARERLGYRLQEANAKTALVKALQSGDKSVKLPVTRIQPKVRSTAFKHVIIVKLAERRLYLYKADKLEKKYSVAIGQNSFPTPRGWYTIVQKRYRPTWVNPGSGWATGMPRTIGPGPGNPLGTRALNLDAPGIRIHGTSNDGSIGSAASHGCMRMHRWDIEDLYDRVDVGTRVIIM